MAKFIELIQNMSQGPKKDLEDQAYRQIVSALLKDNKRGPEKLTDIDSYDSESVIGLQIIPGCVYAMVYEAKAPCVYTTPDGNKLEFTDKHPIVLVTGMAGQTIRGINLNMCNSALRTIILDVPYTIDPNFFEREAEQMTLAGKPALSQSITKFFQNGDAEKNMQKELARRYSINSYASIFRTYNGAGIKQLRLVEPWQWKYLPFLNYEGTLFKKNIEALYKITGIDKISL